MQVYVAQHGFVAHVFLAKPGLQSKMLDCQRDELQNCLVGLGRCNMSVPSV